MISPNVADSKEKISQWFKSSNAVDFTEYSTSFIWNLSAIIIVSIIQLYTKKIFKWGRSDSSLAETHTSSHSYCGGLPTKYPELLTCSGRTVGSFGDSRSTVRHTRLTLQTDNPRRCCILQDLSISFIQITEPQGELESLTPAPGSPQYSAWLYRARLFPLK